MSKIDFPLGALPIANDTGKTINFSASGGHSIYCDKKCRLYDNGCYAVNSEKRQGNLRKSGERRELSPVQVCNSARLQFRNLRNCWARLSSRGSVPKVSQARKIRGFVDSFAAMISEIVESGSKIHFPVESSSKRKFYQAICDSVKPGAVVVRESVQSLRACLRSTSPRAFVVGDSYDGLGIAGRLREAHKLARKIRAGGQSAIVCPKIKPRGYSGTVAKCGDCTACADSRVLVVLYAKH